MFLQMTEVTVSSRSVVADHESVVNGITIRWDHQVGRRRHVFENAAGEVELRAMTRAEENCTAAAPVGSRQIGWYATQMRTNSDGDEDVGAKAPIFVFRIVGLVGDLGKGVPQHFQMLARREGSQVSFGTPQNPDGFTTPFHGNHSPRFEFSDAGFDRRTRHSGSGAGLPGLDERNRSRNCTGRRDESGCHAEKAPSFRVRRIHNLSAESNYGPGLFELILSLHLCLAHRSRKINPGSLDAID